MSFNAAGTKAALIAPAGKIINPDTVELGRAYLESLGYQIIPGKHLFAADRYMAGTDAERAADVMDAYRDPEIKIIFTTAGAAGSQRILPLLDYKTIAANRKPLVGLSDITALQLAVWQKAGVGSLTGFTMSLDFRDGHINGVLAKYSLRQKTLGARRRNRYRRKRRRSLGRRLPELGAQSLRNRILPGSER